MSKSLNTLTSAQLKQAAAMKAKIEGLEKALAAILGGPVTPAASGGKKKKKFTMSAAAKAAISRAAKARWAKIKAAKQK